MRILEYASLDTAVISPELKEKGLTTAEADFPKEGLTVLLDYPTGTGRNTHDFVVTHMLSHSVGNKEAGDTETLAVTKTEKGLQVTLYSLSPIGIAWKPVQVSDNKNPDKLVWLWYAAQ